MLGLFKCLYRFLVSLLKLLLKFIELFELLSHWANFFLQNVNFSLWFSLFLNKFEMLFWKFIKDVCILIVFVFKFFIDFVELLKSILLPFDLLLDLTSFLFYFLYFLCLSIDLLNKLVFSFLIVLELVLKLPFNRIFVSKMK